MKIRPFDTFQADVGMLLRDQPRGTTISVGDFAALYWNGHQVVYVFLNEGGQLDEEFDPADYAWEVWAADFMASLHEPEYRMRAELLDWMKDAPPHEAGE